MNQSLIVRDLLAEVQSDAISHGNWIPVPGNGFLKLREKFKQSFKNGTSDPEGALENWNNAVFRTAARCVDPNSASTDENRDEESIAQLVVGRIQAGKTSSFTGLIRLLADNDYNIFIVVAGSSRNLRNQTRNRLSKDLGDADDIEVVFTGKHFDVDQQAALLARRLLSYDSESPSSNSLTWSKKKLVYVVLKTMSGHINKLQEMFQKVHSEVGTSQRLERSPILIIDDECDQASPNGRTNREQADATATYIALAELRNIVGKHSYVGYTATPYANVLMDVNSELRPEFVTVLDPGSDYTGSEDLFRSSTPFASEIDDWDDATGVPESLKLAMATFFVQAALYHCGYSNVREAFFEDPLKSGDLGQTVTMLIHNDRLVRVASDLTTDLLKLQQIWIRRLRKFVYPQGLPDTAAVHIWSKYFNPAILNLAEGAGGFDIPEDFRAIVVEMLTETQILKIVGDGDAFPEDEATEEKPSWRSRPAWILVGAQLLDRGQTLPVLLNTYMARPPAGKSFREGPAGNIDTLQQRGRFFGHRRTYRKLLRGWFDPQTLETFSEIAELENRYFEILTEMDDNNVPLGQFPLMLPMSEHKKLNLTSKNKLPPSLKVGRGHSWFLRQLVYSDKWISQQAEILNSFNQFPSTSEINLSGKSNTGKLNIFKKIPAPDAALMLRNWAPKSIEHNQFNLAAELIEKWSSEHRDNLEVELVLLSRPENDKGSLLSQGEFRTSLKDEFQIFSPASWKISMLPSSNDLKYVSKDLPTIQVHFIDIKRQPEKSIEIHNAFGLTVLFPFKENVLIRGAIDK